MPKVRIIGIDPGLRNTGWGVIEAEGKRLSYVADGSVHSDADAPLASRLLQIHTQLAEILQRYAPDEAAIEETLTGQCLWSNRHPDTAAAILCVKNLPGS